jgi:glycosyltransferase involved in cell wall biosynthesis
VSEGDALMEKSGADLNRRSERSILFVALASGVGGSTRSLATVLENLPEGLTRIVAVPRTGSLIELLQHRRAIDFHVPLRPPRRGLFSRASRLSTAARIARVAWTERRHLVAMHANGPEELNVIAPAALVTGIPVVVWSHARATSPWMRRLSPWWRRTLRDLRLSAVSDTARDVLTQAGLGDPDQVVIVPNPIDPSDVRATPQPKRADRTVIGYLGSDAPYKGLQLIPLVDRELQDLTITWALFTAERSSENAPVWRELRNMSDGRFALMGKVMDVRQAYAQCDIVFCPSLEETFCRVAAEAMLNGIPVVGSDLPPVRRLLGEDEAGLLFPPGNIAAAAAALRRLALDPQLRTKLGANGIERASVFAPSGIVERLSALYGIDASRT